MTMRILPLLMTICALVAGAKDGVLVVEPGKSIAKCLSGDVREMVLKDGYHSVPDLIEIGPEHGGLTIRAEHPQRAVVVAGEVFPARMFTKTGDVLRLRVSDKVHSVLVKAGNVMLPAGYTAVTAPKDDVDEVVLVNSPKWSPAAK